MDRRTGRENLADSDGYKKIKDIMIQIVTKDLLQDTATLEMVTFKLKSEEVTSFWTSCPLLENVTMELSGF